MESLSSPVFMTDLAVHYLKEGLLVEAVAILELIKTLHPNHAPTYFYLGQISLEKNQDLKTAEFYFKKSIELDSGFPLTYQHLGKVLSLTGKTEDLKKLLKSMESLPKAYAIPVLLEYGFTVEEAGDYANAIKIYKSALKSAKTMDDMDEVSSAIDRCMHKKDLEGLH